jgi:hypothetical protein
LTESGNLRVGLKNSALPWVEFSALYKWVVTTMLGTFPQNPVF